MRNRFAVPTAKTLERYKSERDLAMAKARLLYNNYGSAEEVSRFVAEARDRSRKVVWASRYLGLYRKEG